jgi:hypothetical protein
MDAIRPPGILPGEPTKYEISHHCDEIPSRRLIAPTRSYILLALHTGE